MIYTIKVGIVESGVVLRSVLIKYGAWRYTKVVQKNDPKMGSVLAYFIRVRFKQIDAHMSVWYRARSITFRLGS